MENVSRWGVTRQGVMSSSDEEEPCLGEIDEQCLSGTQCNDISFRLGLDVVTVFVDALLHVSFVHCTQSCSAQRSLAI